MKKVKDFDTEVIFKGTPADVIWKSDVSKIAVNAKLFARKDSDIIFLRNGAFLGAFNDKKEYYLANDEREGLLRKAFKSKKVSENVDIYYINRVVQLENPWGTPSRIPIYDETYDMHSSIGANGTYKFSINNPMKLFSKVQGSQESLTQDSLKAFFRSELNIEIRSELANIFKKNRYSLKDIATITTYEKALSQTLHTALKPLFDDYGVTLHSFYITNISYDEDFLTRMQEAKKDVLVNQVRQNLDQTNRDEFRKDYKMETEREVGIRQAESGKTQDAVLFCVHCGSENIPGSKFCKDCGKELATKKQGICANCQETLPKGAKFCQHCGEKVS